VRAAADIDVLTVSGVTVTAPHVGAVVSVAAVAAAGPGAGASTDMALARQATTSPAVNCLGAMRARRAIRTVRRLTNDMKMQAP
jgi:hypothetical protein